MNRPHLNIVGALRLVAEGRLVPGQKYTALQRAGLIRVIGHGSGSKPVVTEAGRAALSQTMEAA